MSMPWEEEEDEHQAYLARHSQHYRPWEDENEEEERQAHQATRLLTKHLGWIAGREDVPIHSNRTVNWIEFLKDLRNCPEIAFLPDGCFQVLCPPICDTDR